MLTKVDVAGFKAIKSSGPLALGPFTVLIGRNGVGKSSLVEAVQWLQECMVSGVAQATAARFQADAQRLRVLNGVRTRYFGKGASS